VLGDSAASACVIAADDRIRIDLTSMRALADQATIAIDLAVPSEEILDCIEIASVVGRTGDGSPAAIRFQPTSSSVRRRAAKKEYPVGAWFGTTDAKSRQSTAGIIRGDFPVDDAWPDYTIQWEFKPVKVGTSVSGR
jgi:hypothetical protein